jgi:hypothetical protein
MTRSLLSTTADFAFLAFTAAVGRADLGEDYHALVARLGKPNYERSGAPIDPHFVCGTWLTPPGWVFIEARNGRISSEEYFHVSSAEAEAIMSKARVRLPNGEIREFSVENRTENTTTWSAGRFGGGEYRATYSVGEEAPAGRPRDIPELHIFWERIE